MYKISDALKNPSLAVLCHTDADIINLTTAMLQLGYEVKDLLEQFRTEILDGKKKMAYHGDLYAVIEDGSLCEMSYVKSHHLWLVDANEIDFEELNHPKTMTFNNVMYHVI
jgi:hypothetical protein